MFQRILVAVDEDAARERVLKAVQSVAHQEGALVTLAHVSKIGTMIAYPYISRDMIETVLAEDAANSQRVLDKAADEMKKGLSEGVKVNTVCLQGEPALQLLNYAEKNDYQLIVIGSRGLEGVKGLLLGSVSHKVSQAAHCPVLIVH